MNANTDPPLADAWKFLALAIILLCAARSCQ